VIDPAVHIPPISGVQQQPTTKGSSLTLSISLEIDSRGKKTKQNNRNYLLKRREYKEYKKLLLMEGPERGKRMDQQRVHIFDLSECVCVYAYTQRTTTTTRKNELLIYGRMQQKGSAAAASVLCVRCLPQRFSVCSRLCVCVCLSVGLCVSPCASVFEEARIYTYIKGGRPEEACNQPNCKVVVFLSFFLIFLFLSCYFWPAE
jgi:hypothetical protein